MNNFRLRLKIGDQEFEAEGPEEFVRTQLAEFQNFTKHPVATQRPTHPPERTNENAHPFLIDQAQKLITLRLLPRTDRESSRHLANLMLVLLTGYQDQLNEPRISVTQLANNLRLSGHSKLPRLSNAFKQLQNDGEAIKTGSGKGTHYQATQLGLQRGRRLINTLFQHPANS